MLLVPVLLRLKLYPSQYRQLAVLEVPYLGIPIDNVKIEILRPNLISRSLRRAVLRGGIVDGTVYTERALGGIAVAIGDSLVQSDNITNVLAIHRGDATEIEAVYNGSG